jgi:hypothetical protein
MTSSSQQSCWCTFFNKTVLYSHEYRYGTKEHFSLIFCMRYKPLTSNAEIYQALITIMSEENDDNAGNTHDIHSAVAESEVSFDSKATQLLGLVWCWSEEWAGCKCELHRAIRSGNWDPHWELASIRHYPDGPIHSLYSHTNECRACDSINTFLHKRFNGLDCPCWYCQELLDDDQLTDCSFTEDEYEDNIPYEEYYE